MVCCGLLADTFRLLSLIALQQQQKIVVLGKKKKTFNLVQSGVYVCFFLLTCYIWCSDVSNNVADKEGTDACKKNSASEDSSFLISSFASGKFVSMCFMLGNFIIIPNCDKKKNASDNKIFYRSAESCKYAKK